MNTSFGVINTHSTASSNRESCHGCKNSSCGRWAGWACSKGAAGDEYDYSCYEEDKDKEFWSKISAKRKS